MRSLKADEAGRWRVLDCRAQGFPRCVAQMSRGDLTGPAAEDSCPGCEWRAAVNSALTNQIALVCSSPRRLWSYHHCEHDSSESQGHKHKPPEPLGKEHFTGEDLTKRREKHVPCLLLI
ncbi:hypothetical protein AAFF_G00349460 [Aldrovandia affinis]|uniref:Uncharacterized protein n=1 Tax=Aldrovandia affinis TaxID=143900 RepID=A0AAD7WNW9_9TELE|nr:hypothetical protein AAFF_G00349460 [Aldrovandia affinis]